MNFYHTSLLDAVALKFLNTQPFSIYQLTKTIVERLGEVVKTLEGRKMLARYSVVFFKLSQVFRED